MLAGRFKLRGAMRARFLLALGLIGILPLGVVGLGIALLDSRAITEQSARELTGLARGLAGQLEVYVSEVFSDTRGIAALPEIVSMDRARQGALLKELFHHYPKFARISTFDVYGARLASSHPGGAPSIAIRQSFQAAVRQGQQRWEVAYALSTGRSSLVVHTPIRNAERQVIGVLGAVIDFEDLSGVVGKVPVGGRGRAFVLDVDGRVVLHPDRLAVQQRRDYSWIGVPSGGRVAGPGTVRYELENEARIAGYAPLPNIGWSVVVERPEDELLVAANRSWRLALTGLAISAFLALLTAVLLARTLTRPLVELAKAARALGSGGPSAPLPLMAPDSGEVRTLVEAFDAMRKAVQTREDKLQALHEIDMAVTSTLDLRAILDVLLEKIELFFPNAGTHVRLFNKDSGLLEPIACRNIDEKEWKGRLLRSPGRASKVLIAKTPLKVRNIQTDPQTRDPGFFRRQGLVSLLRVPLVAKEESLGVLSVYTREEHEFSDEEVDFLSALAGQAAIAIHNSQLYEEMAKLAADLSRSNRVKDEFLSVMSHELRTPLNVVMGYTGMIRDGLLGNINSEQEKALEKVISRARDQLTMISSILQATHLEAEGVRVEAREVDLEELLADVRSNYAIPLGKELSLVWDIPSDLPVIHTDGEKLKHVLQNLINNAVKFTDKGSVTVSVRAGGRDQGLGVSADPQSLTPNPGWVEFKVADTGIGVARENLTAIFERFRQVDSSETRRYGGIGIGLYIVKKFAELLGGTVEVESEPGKGSTFTVTVPRELPKA